MSDEDEKKAIIIVFEEEVPLLVPKETSQIDILQALVNSTSAMGLDKVADLAQETLDRKKANDE